MTSFISRFALAAVSVCSALLVSPSKAQENVVAKPIVMLTGDSWSQDGQVLKLYGVQACIRGTQYTDRAGLRQDCGDVATSYLAAMLKDTNPSCTGVAVIKFETVLPETTLVTCRFSIAGNALDLGAVLISQGFAVAALSREGKSVYGPYAALESVAKATKKGLWAFADFPDPNRLLSRRPQK